MRATPTHPSWCEYQLALYDETHTHTAAAGTIHLARNATQLVLIQPPVATQPVLTLHIVVQTSARWS